MATLPKIRRPSLGMTRTRKWATMPWKSLNVSPRARGLRRRLLISRRRNEICRLRIENRRQPRSQLQRATPTAIRMMSYETHRIQIQNKIRA